MSDNTTEKPKTKAPILDLYIHCGTCIVESKGERYTQSIEVGIQKQEHDDDLVVINCKIHDTVVATFKTNKFGNETCGCCDTETENT